MPHRRSRDPDAQPSRVFYRLVAQPDEALAEAVDAIARRLREPGLGREEIARLMMARVLAEALLRDRQSRRRARCDAALHAPDERTRGHRLRDDLEQIGHDRVPCPRCEEAGLRGNGTICALCGGPGCV
jgi:hypothetical protein